jgi:hypothetical protein
MCEYFPPGVGGMGKSRQTRLGKGPTTPQPHAGYIQPKNVSGTA